MPARPSIDTLILECPVAIVQTDADHRVRSCNPAFEKLFLYAEAEAAGRPLEEIIGLTKTTARRKDGRTVYVDPRVIPEFSRGDCVGYLYMLQDVSSYQEAIKALDSSEARRRRTEKQLAAARDAATSARESERARIARDLHDDIAQQLALLQIGIDQLKTSGAPPAMLAEIDALSKQTGAVINAIRSFVYDLHPVAQGANRAEDDLNSLCVRLGQQLDLSIAYHSRSVPPNVPKATTECLHRVLQEALSNVARHSGAQRVSVRLWGLPDALHLVIRDFGSGFDTSANYHGIGLTTMRERVSAARGMIWISSKPQLSLGTLISVRLPLPSQP